MFFSIIEHIFKIRRTGSNVKTEVIAGFTTFATMAYILFVNPILLSKGGMPFNGVIVATAVSATIACLFMGFWANLPFALAAGMGYNAFFAFSVCASGVSWQTALGAVFIDGIIFFIISLLPFRKSIFKSIPLNLKLAASVGIGIFIAFIGLTEAKVIVAEENVFVSLGNIKSAEVILTLLGILFTGFLISRKVKGSFLIGIITITIAGMFVIGETKEPLSVLPNSLSDIISVPSFSGFKSVLLQLNLKQAFSLSMIPVIFTFTFMDIFDTIGTMSGLSSKLNILDKQGNFQGSGKVLVVDAVSTFIGAICGTTTVTTYIESAS